MLLGIDLCRGNEVCCTTAVNGQIPKGPKLQRNEKAKWRVKTASSPFVCMVLVTCESSKTSTERLGYGGRWSGAEWNVVEVCNPPSPNPLQDVNESLPLAEAAREMQRVKSAEHAESGHSS